MSLSVRTPEYKIPEYSLTGDLLAYMNCGLQYRYHNRGSLPPSLPVQLWFGEFVHGLMGESYLEWSEIDERQEFPWGWEEVIRPIELRISRRLKSQGLNPAPRVFCPYESDYDRSGLCLDPNHPHKLIASQRADEAINTWGRYLFPLIDEPEVKLKGIRNMPSYIPDISRSNYYGITGIIDVLSSVNIESAQTDNLILRYLDQNHVISDMIESLEDTEYEIIIDYKGTRRPSTDDPMWDAHNWQILTYAWLRRQQPNSRRIISGIIFYLNELAPSRTDLNRLRREIEDGITDIIPEQEDLEALFRWAGSGEPPEISRDLRTSRSIRVIPTDDASILNSLNRFDNVVNNIENCVLEEMRGNGILGSWNPVPRRRTCTACDFKTFCTNPAPRRYDVSIP